MKIVPAICTFVGVIFSCTNYFRVIFTGGVGKNGSTIAVSCLSVDISFHFINVLDFYLHCNHQCDFVLLVVGNKCPLPCPSYRFCYNLGYDDL